MIHVKRFLLSESFFIDSLIHRREDLKHRYLLFAAVQSELIKFMYFVRRCNQFISVLEFVFRSTTYKNWEIYIVYIIR